MSFPRSLSSTMRELESTALPFPRNLSLRMQGAGTRRSVIPAEAGIQSFIYGSPINPVPKCYPINTFGYKLYWGTFGDDMRRG
ncbi:MAG TPA: hypothetical protein VNN20_11985, partial [Thermodesulfobacteriota bacterium]|nr:hypothetical protein [Thermodesulfobacteriota bacterium]